MKTITNIIYPAFATLAFACLAFSPTALAQLSPAPDGGYPGRNTAEGDDALFSLTTGESNTAIGFVALYSNTTGIRNTATGDSALFANTTGESNTADGAGALGVNTTGSFNTAVGDGALTNNTSGAQNTATGFEALYNNATASFNTAYGFHALYSNTTGSLNNALGRNALMSNTTGAFNTATGGAALFLNTTGTGNTATGRETMHFNTTGNNNVASGFLALFNNTTGSNNIALGVQAGNNLTTGDNNIEIGNAGVAGEARKIRIGIQGTQNGTFIAGISGSAVGGGTTVVVNPAGKLGVAPSSARFKDEIKPMDKASEAILALKPVSFRYKEEVDLQGIPQFGLIAEEVEKVNPDLVVHDEEGKPFTVRYEAVNAMLLNEFLKEHRNAQTLQATVAQQQRQIDTLTVGLQKVTARLESGKAAPRTVSNNH